jgi:hypothetical protein
MKPLIFALLIAATGFSNLHAQSFGEGMTTPSVEEMHKLLSGNAFTVDRPDGNHWKIEFKANGYYFMNTNSGYSDSGEWKVENGKLCAQPKKTPAGCSEAKLNNGLLVLKRPNGEIVTYKPKD